MAWLQNYYRFNSCSRTLLLGWRPFFLSETAPQAAMAGRRKPAGSAAYFTGELWASLHFKAGGAQFLQGSHDQPQAPTPAPETLIKQAICADTFQAFTGVLMYRASSP